MKTGERGVITAVAGEGAMRKRLLDMGLTPNTAVELYKKAPMGDPVELIVRGYHLTLRLSETEAIALRAESSEEVAARVQKEREQAALAAAVPPKEKFAVRVKSACKQIGARFRAVWEGIATKCGKTSEKTTDNGSQPKGGEQA